VRSIKDGSLEGEVVLIAGVGSGMGSACALALAEDGADIAMIDVSPEHAIKAAGEVKAMGRRAHLELADLLDPAATQRAVVAASEAMGRIDHLVTVAGGMAPYQKWRPFDEWELSDWDEIVDRNLRYVAVVTRAALPLIEAQGGGSVVFITSMSGIQGAPLHAAYGAAKAGLVNLARSLGSEYGARGVRVNTVAPGGIATDAVASELKDPKSTSEYIAMKRLGRPDEIAEAVKFLVSRRSSYITGQTLLVDGGRTLFYPRPG
jgi:NAD(P)-dependent dehydrogenase (short-subunit alcohol dehydrogenase family)